MLDKFVKQARDMHPDLSECEIAIRAEHLRIAFYKRMAIKSAQARRRRGAMVRREPRNPTRDDRSKKPILDIHTD
jgi:hypothetical protein